MSIINTNTEIMYQYIETFATTHSMCETLKALPFATEKHKNQFRSGKEKLPYIIHPLTIVCHALALGFKEDTLIASILLHDVCEDCGVSIEELPVSKEVQEIVNLLTFTVNDTETKQQAKICYYNAISSNREATIIKLLDRCHNVSSMACAFSHKKLLSYIAETKEFIIPLLEKAKNKYPEYNHSFFLLEYHIYSVICSIETMIK